MKKLNKLQINSDKLINDKELRVLRGGYDPNGCEDGVDKWLCSYTEYGVRTSGNFCVPSGDGTPEYAENWIE